MKFTDVLTNGLITQNESLASYILGAVLTAVIAYLLGSLNFGIIFSRARGDDVRLHGSGNAGTTNIMRTYGKALGILTFVCDFLKSAFSVFVGMVLMPADGFAYVAAFFCMLGHIYPIYFKFRGGKGVAVFAGAIFCLNPIAALFSALVFVMVLLFSKYVSLSSMTMSLIFPILNFYIPFSFFGGLGETVSVAALANYMLRMLVPLFMAGLVVFAHVENIRRIAAGTERKAGESKQNK